MNIERRSERHEIKESKLENERKCASEGYVMLDDTIDRGEREREGEG